MAGALFLKNSVAIAMLHFTDQWLRFTFNPSSLPFSIWFTYLPFFLFFSRSLSPHSLFLCIVAVCQLSAWSWCVRCLYPVALCCPQPPTSGVPRLEEQERGHAPVTLDGVPSSPVKWNSSWSYQWHLNSHTHTEQIHTTFPCRKTHLVH